MALPRLPFLYPNLLRSVRSCEPPSRPRRLLSQSGFYTSSHQHGQDTYPRRYGPATESHLPPPSRPKEGLANPPLPASSTAKEAGQTQQFDTLLNRAQAPDPKRPAKDDISEPGRKTADLNVLNALEQREVQEAPSGPETAGQNSPEQENQGPRSPPDSPLDAVLQMPSESASFPPSGVGVLSPESHKPAHLSSPRYVHQFDTYGTVRALEKGGFTEEQSITIMKAIRGILQDNLELARESITSKSDFENELYLFKAACSELQSSLQTARSAEVQRQRSSRTHLQHEVDILSQRLNQELARLKDDLKGMFNDHKMTTKELQRSLDTVIQELNYKITISLTSDGKGTTEGLRWILARRAASAILTSAIMIILFLKYYSVRTHSQAKEATAPKDHGVHTEPSPTDMLASQPVG
ncbi:hypothetical protein V8E54_005804 [Elaphomyces granulatus]